MTSTIAPCCFKPLWPSPFPQAKSGSHTLYVIYEDEFTILKEAEQHVGSKYVDQVLDSLYAIEMGMRHFFIRAEMGKNVGRKKEEVDEDYKQAAALAALVAPYRHARLSAVKLAGDPNNSVPFKDDASAEELREEIMRRLEILTSAGLINLQALPAPSDGIVKRPKRGLDQSGINGE